ncbi:hypothetical protein [Halorubrum sp. Ea8]|uniref:hypothetical protein n=1 Tax=Halorubrum sp. Ea8 TaxID=1383841 RepID=UPI000B9886FC|nr:hypothetical protein [Halorubrum sp. Ea8]OYR50042.1 hypothetical protein DJ74_06740 [Halorubrum sp. Ea8]
MESDKTDSTTLAERLRTDGGVIVEEQRDDARGLIEAEHECPNGEKWCSGPDADSTPLLCVLPVHGERVMAL